MDTTTWGNGPAAMSLADMVKDDQHMTGKVGRKIAVFQRRLNYLKTITSTVDRLYLSHLLLTDYAEQIDRMDSPLNVRTHLRNVLTGIYRDAIKQGKASGQ